MVAFWHRPYPDNIIVVKFEFLIPLLSVANFDKSRKLSMEKYFVFAFNSLVYKLTVYEIRKALHLLVWKVISVMFLNFVSKVYKEL